MKSENDKEDNNIMFVVMFVLLLLKSLVMTIGLKLFGIEVQAWQVAVIVCIFEMAEYFITMFLEWIASQRSEDDE